MVRRGMLLLVALAMFVVLTAGSGASPAAAQSSNDVQVDPNSPAGSQYDIPVRKARREAQGANSKQNQDDPSLFGEGVTPDNDASDQSASNDSGSASTPVKKAAAKKRVKEKKKVTTTTAVVPSSGGGDDGSVGSTTLLATPTSDETSGGPGLLLAVVGIALALVLAATLSGWLIRRRAQ